VADRVIIHAGFHKSGTTALQHAFDLNKNSLKEHGVYYPLNAGRAHHRAAWGLTERVWGWRTNGGKLVPIKAWKALVQQIKKSPGTVLISSEFFTEAKDHHIAQARKDLGNLPVTLVFTVRPFAKILASSYQQFLKYGIKMRFEPWLEKVFAEKSESKVTPTFWNRTQVDEVVGRWAKHFGSENVIVILADESKPEFIFEEFAEILKVPSSILPIPEIGGNRSMTLEETELLYLINKIYDRSGGWEQYRALVRDGYVRFLADHTQADPKAERLRTPQWAVDRAREINHLHFHKLQEMNVEIRGNLEGFVEAPVLTGDYAAPEKITMELAAQFLASYDYSIIRHVPRQVLASEVKRRLKVSTKRFLKGVR
jgi:hypothetical protein